jgi:hypothetical protein
LSFHAAAGLGGAENAARMIHSKVLSDLINRRANTPRIPTKSPAQIPEISPSHQALGGYFTDDESRQAPSLELNHYNAFEVG